MMMPDDLRQRERIASHPMPLESISELTSLSKPKAVCNPYVLWDLLELKSDSWSSIGDRLVGEVVARKLQI